MARIFSIVCEVPSQKLCNTFEITGSDRVAVRREAVKRFRQRHHLSPNIHVTARATDTGKSVTPVATPQMPVETLMLMGHLFEEQLDHQAQSHPDYAKFRSIIDELPDGCELELRFWPGEAGQMGARMLMQLEVTHLIAIAPEEMPRFLNLITFQDWSNAEARVITVRPVMPDFKQKHEVSRLILAISNITVRTPTTTSAEAPS